jgi:hypothetical protein
LTGWIAAQVHDQLARINQLYFNRSIAKDQGTLLLNSPQQQRSLGGDDRERIASARQAAEALFTSGKQVIEHPGSVPPSEPSPRKPRILRALPPAPSSRDQAAVLYSSEERAATQVPSSQFARIRAWVEYGMTAAQVAAVYGVAVGAIERILRQA